MPPRSPLVFFEILGAELFRGRTFNVQEGLEGAARVVILNHRFWQDRYEAGSDPTGESLILNRVPYTVIGILPRDFEFFNPQVELWVPLSLDPRTLSRDRRDTIGVGRMRDGITMDQLHDDMENIRRELEREYPESNRGFVIDVLNLQYDIPDRRGRIMFGLLQGAVMFVLLIACVNIANLLLARTQARRREIALRASLGAGRLRIVRQLLTESILLAAMGGALGLGLGIVGLRVLAKSFAALVPSYWIPTVDTRVILVTFGLTALAGLLFGLSPAWMSFKVNLAEVLKEGGRGSMGADRRFVSRALVVAEIFFSVIFLGGGSVLVESFVALRNRDPGFDMENLLTVTLVLPDNDAEQIALAERIIERAESLPGVLDATLVSSLPLNIYVNTGAFSVDEQPLGPDDPSPRAVLLITSPGYLDTLSFPALRGRFF